MRKFIFIFIFITSSVFANTWILFYGGSKHFVHDNDPNTRWNETHNLKGIAQDINTPYADLVQISYFKNSVFNDSTFISAVKKCKQGEYFYYGYQYGIVNGYDLGRGAFIPAITALAGVEYKNFAADFTSFGREIIMVLRFGF